MNTYTKYCPNVFVAKCSQEYNKGDIITLTTKYGKENECEVHNLVAKKDGFFYYSITRTDGWNRQERAKAKAERLQSWANSAEKKSLKYYEASQEGKDFLSLAEPIKIGHHSEKRHRALIERNHNRMSKCVEFDNKAKDYENRAEYWQKMEGKIDLSMPESIEYFENKVQQLEARQKGLKDGSIQRLHSFDLTYCTKDLKKATADLETAKKLWADN